MSRHSIYYLVRRCLLPPVLLEALPVAVAAAGGLAAHTRLSVTMNLSAWRDTRLLFSPVTSLPYRSTSLLSMPWNLTNQS